MRYTHYDRIDLWNEVSRSVSRIDPFIMRIYFAYVFGVMTDIDLSGFLFTQTTSQITNFVYKTRGLLLG